MIAGQVGIAGHLVISNKTGIGAQAGILKSINKEGQQILGSPAFDVKEYYRAYAVYKQLPDLNSRLRELQTKLRLLEAKAESRLNGQ
jgi:UDP-3-O-[3-hydroxymyristoyl] glucosamine N-acyltransferase